MQGEGPARRHEKGGREVSGAPSDRRGGEGKAAPRSLVLTLRGVCRQQDEQEGSSWSRRLLHNAAAAEAWAAPLTGREEQDGLVQEEGAELLWEAESRLLLPSPAGESLVPLLNQSIEKVRTRAAAAATHLVLPAPSVQEDGGHGRGPPQVGGGRSWDELGDPGKSGSHAFVKLWSWGRRCKHLRLWKVVSDVAKMHAREAVSMQGIARVDVLDLDTTLPTMCPERFSKGPNSNEIPTKTTIKTAFFNNLKHKAKKIWEH